MTDVEPRVLPLRSVLVALAVAGVAAVVVLLWVRAAWSDAQSPLAAGAQAQARGQAPSQAPGPVGSAVAVHITPERTPVSGSGRPSRVVPGPEAPADPAAAAAARDFLAGAVDLDPSARARWVRAYTDPSDRPRVTDFLSRWIRQLTDGRGADPSSGAADLRVRTLGYRTLAAERAAGGTTVRVMLWQQVIRGELAEPPDDAAAGSAYVLTVVSVRRLRDDLVIASLDGVVDGPAPDPGVDVIYPPILP